MAEGVGIEDTVAVGLARIDHLEAQQCTIKKILVEQLVAQGSQFGIRPLGQMGGHMSRLRLGRPGRLDRRSLGRRRSRLGATRTGSEASAIEQTTSVMIRWRYVVIIKAFSMRRRRHRRGHGPTLPLFPALSAFHGHRQGNICKFTHYLLDTEGARVIFT